MLQYKENIQLSINTSHTGTKYQRIFTKY